VEQINAELSKGEGQRGVAGRWGLTKSSVARHAINCLQLTQEQRNGHTIEQIVDVRAEYADQVRFAKKLKDACEAYLSDPDDPLRIAIIPHAGEIEVIYHDYKDLDERGKPKKKKADLARLLTEVSKDRKIGVEKINIKHMDLRKFALEALATVDMTIDKFARMEGAYTDNKPNPLASALKVLDTIQRTEGTDLRGAMASLEAAQTARQVELVPQHLLDEIARQNGFIRQTAGTVETELTGDTYESKPVTTEDNPNGQ